MSSIKYDTNKMGTVEHDGMVIELQDMAEPTSRLLPDNETRVEWAAPGKNSDGENVTVYWLHEDEEGVEPENYDWSDVARVTVD